MNAHYLRTFMPDTLLRGDLYIHATLQSKDLLIALSQEMEVNLIGVYT